MRMLIRFCFPLLLLVLCRPAQSQTSLEAVQVLQNQYGKVYASRLVAVTGDNGQPQPKDWHLFAYDLQNPSLISHFVVRGGKITTAVMLDPERGKEWAAPVLAWESVKVHSKQVFEIADQTARLALVGFDSIDYRLMTNRRDRTPVYRLELKDSTRKVVGYLRISAVDGALLSQSWPGKQGIQMPWSGQEALDWQIVKDEMAAVGRGIGGAFRKIGRNVRDQFQQQ